MYGCANIKGWEMSIFGEEEIGGACMDVQSGSKIANIKFLHPPTQLPTLSTKQHNLKVVFIFLDYCLFNCHMFIKKTHLFIQ